MNFRKMYDFLRDLNEPGHNNKSWMDQHRSDYESVRDDFISYLDQLNEKLREIDPDYTDTPGKKAIHRINNNKMYHPEKPTYKNRFGASMDRKKGKSDFYIHLGLDESFIACGFYHPDNEVLNQIRQEIDYHQEEFKDLVNAKEFTDLTGGLIREDSLKTSPKGYTQDHPLIDFLNLKSFAATHPLTQKTVISSAFTDQVLECYEIMMPFRKFVDRAVSSEPVSQ